MGEIEKNLNEIKEKIASIAKEHNRGPTDVQLIGVSKKQCDERIDEALLAGHRLFGENRVQEAITHWESRKNSYSDIELHLIGPLQTNKIKEALSIFDVIQTIDREKLVIKLSEELSKQNKNLPCFIQVNTGEETQKAGVAPCELADFITFCKDKRLDIRGLMCIPPIDDVPDMHFGLLRNLAVDNGLADLSMGMSSDYESAIALGATYIRVGASLFGDRET